MTFVNFDSAHVVAGDAIIEINYIKDNLIEANLSKYVLKSDIENLKTGNAEQVDLTN